MANVYLDFESMEFLNEIKKENPNFSLAGLVQDAIRNYLGKESEDVAELYKKLGENKTKIDYYNNENIYLENKIENIKKQHEDEEIKQKEQEEYEKEQEKIELFFKDLSDNGWKEYKEGIKEGKWKSTLEFYNSQAEGVKP